MAHGVNLYNVQLALDGAECAHATAACGMTMTVAVLMGDQAFKE